MAIIPNNRFFEQQWHLKLIEAPEAWELLNGGTNLSGDADEIAFGSSNITIAMIDHGIDTTHPAFQGHLTDTTKNKIAYFIHRSSNLSNFNFEEHLYSPHGTQTAGVVAAKAQIVGVASYDGVGVIGVAPNCGLICISHKTEKTRLGFFTLRDVAGLKNFGKKRGYQGNLRIKQLLGLKTYLTQLISPRKSDAPDKGKNLIELMKAGPYADIFSLSIQSPHKANVFTVEDFANAIFNDLTFFGRKGKGCLVVVGSGNNSASLEIPNTMPLEYRNQYAASNKPIIVGATAVSNSYDPDTPGSLSMERRASYSNFGSRVDIVAPAGGDTPGFDQRATWTSTQKHYGELLATTPLELPVRRRINSNLLEFNNVNGIFPFQYIGIGDPTSVGQIEIRLVTDVDTATQRVAITPPLTIPNTNTAFFNPLHTKTTVATTNSNILTLESLDGAYVGGRVYIGSLGSASSGSDYLISAINTANRQITITFLNGSPASINTTSGTPVVFQPVLATVITTTATTTQTDITLSAVTVSGTEARGLYEGAEIIIHDNPMNIKAWGRIESKNEDITSTASPKDQIITFTSSITFAAGSTPINLNNEIRFIRLFPSGDVDTRFKGTSSATPVVSGVIALMLSAKSSLNALEVKDLLENSAEQIDPTHADWTTRNGKDFNPHYGHGRVNALEAVRAAQNYNHDTRKLKIRDNENNSDPINSPDIWVSPATAPITPTTYQQSGLHKDEPKLSEKQQVSIRVINDGTSLPSLRGTTVRCLFAFTNASTPSFPFPDSWIHQEGKDNGENIVLLGIEEIGVEIPTKNGVNQANKATWNEHIVTIDWDTSDATIDWKKINPKGLNAYILAHIAPFDGDGANEVSLVDVSKNKHLTYKPIAPFYIWFTDDTGQHLDQPTKVEVPFSGATVNTSFATKIFGIYKNKVSNTYLKLTLKHTGENIPDEVVKFKDEGGGNWGYVPNGIPDWVIVQNPDTPDLPVNDHKNLFFECGLTVSSRHSRVTVEVIDETTAGTEVVLGSQVFTCGLSTAIPTGMQQNPTQPFHTFTDFTHLTQSDTQAYGPVKGQESTQFRTSALFTSTQTQKAYAVVGGAAFIQEITGTDLLNLVLKPDEQPIVNGMVVKYFIYRGLKKSSFLDASGQVLTESNSTNNDMLQRMWQVKDEWNQQQSEIKQNLNPPENHTPEGLKREDVGLATKNEDKLADTETIDRVFEHTFQPIIEGWQLGEFETSGNFGLEVVVDYPGHSNTLAEVRMLDYLIKVDPFVGNIADGDHLGEFDKLFAREKILGYVDPAAYYGAFYEFSLKNHVGSAVEKIQGKTIKTKIIDKFFTKNNIYIDIRNELGNSINLYDTYKSANNPPHIQLNGASTAYQYQNWPIIRLEVINNSLTDIKCQLPIGSNTDPILYLVTGAFKSDKNKFKILNAAGSNTNEFSLKVPEKDKQVFSYHFKITYNKRHRTLETPNGNISTGIFNRLGRYDNIFPFNQISVHSTEQGNTIWHTQGELRYLGNTSITDGKDVNLQIGAAKDTIGETMYGFVKLPTEVGGKDNYQVASYPLGLDGGEQQVATFLHYLDSLKFLNSANPVPVNDPHVVDVIKFHTQAAETILQEDVQHLYSVSYTHDEATALTQAASIFDQRYPIYFVFQEGVYPKGAINKFKLALQGVVHDPTTNVYQTQIVSTTEPIWCYAFDDTSNSFFSSAYAAAFKNLKK
ncbi:MAG TPA: hypothetical protein DCS93_36720 [Microscillaceae bacterium]|nr:hypothetical protein [Microscillaceae bacterium]